LGTPSRVLLNKYIYMLSYVLKLKACNGYKSFFNGHVVKILSTKCFFLDLPNRIYIHVSFKFVEFVSSAALLESVYIYFNIQRVFNIITCEA